MASELYREEQYFDKLFMWLVIGLGIIPMTFILGWGIYKQIILGQPWGDNPMSDDGLLLITVFVLVLLVGITMLFINSKLETEVNRWGVRYRFSPFIKSWKEIAKHDIKTYKIRKYSIWRGYGVRWGLDGVKTLNVKGNEGIEFQYGEKKKLLIGTQQAEQFLKAMDNMLQPETE